MKVEPTPEEQNEVLTMKEAHDLSVTEFAQIVNVNPETIRDLIRRGNLKGFYKIGRQWRISVKVANQIRKLEVFVEVL